MKRVILIATIILLLLFSCQNSSFTYSAESIRLYSVYLNDELESQYIIFRVNLSVDGDYNLELTSPSKELTFSSNLKKSRELYESEKLYISSTAQFEKGAYSVRVINEKNEELSFDCTLQYSPVTPTLDPNDSRVTKLEYYKDDIRIAEKKEHDASLEYDYVYITSSDSYNNTTITKVAN